jgi:hypothetical protein
LAWPGCEGLGHSNGHGLGGFFWLLAHNGKPIGPAEKIQAHEVERRNVSPAIKLLSQYVI